MSARNEPRSNVIDLTRVRSEIDETTSLIAAASTESGHPAERTATGAVVIITGEGAALRIRVRTTDPYSYRREALAVYEADGIPPPDYLLEDPTA